MKKKYLTLASIIIGMSLSSCSMMQTKPQASNKEMATKVATNVATSVASDLMAGRKIDGQRMLIQNLPELSGLASNLASGLKASDALKYIKILKDMGLDKQILQYILPQVFSSNLANNRDVASELVGVLTKSVGKKQASSLFQQAVKGIAYSKIAGMATGEKANKYGYVMDFLGQQLPVSNLLKAPVKNPNQAKKVLQKEVMNTLFAKLLK